jgi:SAM-dependent methyltransferase
MGTLLRRLADCLLLVPAMDPPLAHCGAGMGCANLVDIKPSREMLEEARKKFDPDYNGVGAAAPGGGGGSANATVTVTFENSSAKRLPLGDGTAEAVVSTSAFHFFRDGHLSLLEMERVLRPRGTLMIIDWCADYPSFGHITSWRGCAGIIAGGWDCCSHWVGGGRGGQRGGISIRGRSRAPSFAGSWRRRGAST